LSYKENSGFERTACLHQIMLSTGKYNATESFEMLKVAFGDQTVRRIQVFELFSKFRSGVTSVEVAEHLGCPLTSRTDESVD
jgi:hypothetical protein